jgi:hypothetical protein
MKIDYDYPSHVNDVIITSCIAIHGVKKIKILDTHQNSQTIFFKFVQLHLTHAKRRRLILTLCTQNQNL